VTTENVFSFTLQLLSETSHSKNSGAYHHKRTYIHVNCPLPVVTTSHPDCILICGTSLGVSPARRYHSPTPLLLNVPGQIAAFWDIYKKIVRHSCHILIKTVLTRQVVQRYSIPNFMKICPMGVELFHAGGRRQTDHTDMAMLKSFFATLRTRLKRS
jgi:hypothetical protein